MNMSVEAIKIYNIFKQKNFTDEEAKEIVGYFDTAVKSGAATKEDLLISVSELKQEISNVRSELKQEIASVRQEIYALDKKFTVLGILILVVTIAMNPRVLDFFGKIAGIMK